MLSGLCKGLIADRGLNEAEIRYLDWWLTQNGTLKTITLVEISIF
jgi:hypothetical protein